MAETRICVRSTQVRGIRVARDTELDDRRGRDAAQHQLPKRGYGSEHKTISNNGVADTDQANDEVSNGLQKARRLESLDQKGRRLQSDGSVVMLQVITT